MLRKIRLAVTGLFFATLIFYGICYLANQVLFQEKMDEVVIEDCRNEGIRASVHLKHLVDYRVLVINYQAVPGAVGPKGVFRSFVQLSNKLEDYEFDRVVLAFRSVPRVYIDGETFNRMGDRYGKGKMLELVARFASNLRLMNGDLAFSALPHHYSAMLEQELHGGITETAPGENGETFTLPGFSPQQD